MTKSIFKALAVAGAAITAATSASALSIGPLDVDYQGYNASADIRVGAPGYGGIATSFNMSEGTIFGDFIGWCLDIGTTIKDSKYTFKTIGEAIFQNGGSAVNLTSDQKNDIQKLYNSAYSSLDLSNGTQAGGFQLALWEIVYEDKATNGLNLGTGDFTETQAEGAAARAQANTYLGNLDTQTGNYFLYFLESEELAGVDGHKSQNLVTGFDRTGNVPGVPLPGAGWLLIGAFSGAAALRRKRKA